MGSFTSSYSSLCHMLCLHTHLSQWHQAPHYSSLPSLDKGYLSQTTLRQFEQASHGKKVFSPNFLIPPEQQADAWKIQKIISEAPFENKEGKLYSATRIKHNSSEEYPHSTAFASFPFLQQVCIISASSAPHHLLHKEGGHKGWLSTAYSMPLESYSDVWTSYKAKNS